MSLTKFLAAAALGAATLSASATPLDSMTGAVNIKLVGLSTQANTYAGTNESTWGVGAITEIVGLGGKKWQAGSSDGSYLYFMLYGITDIAVMPNARGVTIFQAGATNLSSSGAADGLIHLDVYRSTTPIFELDSDYNANPNDRTGYNSFSLLSGLGPAYLSLTFGEGRNALHPEATLIQNALSTNLPTDGTGSFFADVAGGTAASTWNTNRLIGLADSHGNPTVHDLSGNFTLTTNGALSGSGICSNAELASNSCFAGFINDPLKAFLMPVPEPDTFVLFGVGLAGLAIFNRRRMRS